MSDPLNYLKTRGEEFRKAKEAVPKVAEKLKSCTDSVHSLEIELERDKGCVRISFEGDSKEFRFGYRDGGIEIGGIKKNQSWAFKLGGDPVNGSIESVLAEIIKAEF